MKWKLKEKRDGWTVNSIHRYDQGSAQAFASRPSMAFDLSVGRVVVGVAGSSIWDQRFSLVTYH